MHKNHVEITTGIGSHTLKIDGHDLSNAVRRAEVQCEGGSPAHVLLDLAIPEDLTYSGEADVVIPDETKALLVRLGWTAPEQNSEDRA